MLSQSVLESAFKVHFDEMDKCEQNKCCWALLHLVVVLPDICAALESDNGLTNGNLYKDWYRQHLTQISKLNGEDWYSIRRGLLHRGTTLSDQGNYKSYSFSQPTPNGVVVHRITFNQPSGSHLHLDVGELKKEILAAMRKWFQQLEQNSDSARSQNVSQHLAILARADNSLATFIQGFNPAVWQSTTASPTQGGSQ